MIVDAKPRKASKLFDKTIQFTRVYCHMGDFKQGLRRLLFQLTYFVKCRRTLVKQWPTSTKKCDTYAKFQVLLVFYLPYTANANMADLSACQVLVARKRGLWGLKSFVLLARLSDWVYRYCLLWFVTCLKEIKLKQKRKLIIFPLPRF